jgi:uncharacterized protein with HEPN domain
MNRAIERDLRLLVMLLMNLAFDPVFNYKMQKIVGLRNRIFMIRQYIRIIIWGIVINHLPNLKKKLIS